MAYEVITYTPAQWGMKQEYEHKIVRRIQLFLLVFVVVSFIVLAKMLGA